MAAAANAELTGSFPDQEEVGPQPLAAAERCLTEVNNLNRLRLPDGSHAQWVLDELFKNLVPYVKEGGIPNAVSRVEHPYLETAERDETGRNVKAYMWLGRTAIQNAESGYVFHELPAALRRVAVEVDEARDAEANLRPGVTKFFISPRMSRADAPYEEAKAEHLADDDSVRASEAVVGADGNIQKRVVESLLIRDVPLEAWVTMLEDPDNIFGKAIVVDDPDSALSVMKVHRELELPAGSLPEGAVSVVEAVTAYIEDPLLRLSVEEQLERFREDQSDMHAKAVNLARRWQDFEIALADSLHEGRATQPVTAFINSMQDKWNEKDLAVILAHQLPDAQYKMSRELAVIVEKAKQMMLLVKAGVITGNQKIIGQMDAETAKRIYHDEMVVQAAYASGYRREIQAIEADQDRRIASQHVKGVGGGCVGDNDTEFSNDQSEAFDNIIKSSLSSLEKKVGKIKRGECVVTYCPTRPGEVKVGACGICIDRCQKIFDRGEDPSKTFTITRAAGNNTVRGVVQFITPAAEKPAARSVV